MNFRKIKGQFYSLNDESDKKIEDCLKKYGINLTYFFIVIFILFLVGDIYSLIRHCEFIFKKESFFHILLIVFATYSFSSAKKISMPTVSPTLIALTFGVFELCSIFLLFSKDSSIIIIGFLPVIFTILLFYKETFNDLSTKLGKSFKFILLILCAILYTMVFISYSIVDEYEYAKKTIPKAIESIMLYRSDYEERSAIWGIQQIYSHCEKIIIEDKEEDNESLLFSQTINIKSLPFYSQITYEDDYAKDFTDKNYEGIIYKPDKSDYENEDFTKKYNITLYFNPMYNFDSLFYINESKKISLSWIFIFISSVILTWYEILIIINTFKYSQELNDKLKEKNAYLEFANEEIIAQREALKEKNAKLSDYKCIYEMMTAEFDRNTSEFQNSAQHYFTPNSHLLNDLDKLIHDHLHSINKMFDKTDSEIKKFLESIATKSEIEKNFLIELISDVKNTIFTPVIESADNILNEVRDNTLVIIPETISIENIIKDIFENHIGIDNSLLKNSEDYRLRLDNNISDAELKKLVGVKINLIPGKLKSIIFYLIKNATIAMEINHPSEIEFYYVGNLLLTVGIENRELYIELKDNSGGISKSVIDSIYHRANEMTDNSWINWEDYIKNGIFIKFFIQNMMDGRFEVNNYSDKDNIKGVVARVYLPFV